MEYSIKSLAKMAKISTRTLRYYDEIGLLPAKRTNSSGYRVYGQREVELLQQIMFYRALEMPLEEIKKIVSSDNFDPISSLNKHKELILAKRAQLDLLLENIEKTLQSMKGERLMSNEERFNGFADKYIEENERRFGKEIRKKYGDDVIDASNNRLRKMSKDQWKELEALGDRVNQAFAEAMADGDPASEKAQNAVKLHRQWLSAFGDYSDEAYIGLTEMYVADKRFTDYYDKIKPGLAVFIRDAAKASVGK